VNYDPNSANNYYNSDGQDNDQGYYNDDNGTIDPLTALFLSILAH